MAKEEIIKCRYAGDPNDEFCKNCDGVTVEEDGQSFAATSCCGYEPTPAADPSEEPAEERETSVLSQEKGEAVPVHNQGVTTVIRAESGLTREINGAYYKFMFSEERAIPEGADMKAEKQALWDAVNAEVDNQLESVIHG